MSKKRNGLQEDRRSIQTNGLMEAFSISLAILTAVNIYKGKVLFSQGLDLIPCIAFGLIGISAYLKKRQLLIKNDVSWYFVYSSLVVWVVALIIEFFAPLSLSVFILGVSYIILNQLIQRDLSK